MSQAEELLNSVSEEIPMHNHPVPDTDTYFIIDPITRKIENTNHKKSVVMQYDHNSERFTFELPRYIDGHDMLECTSVTVNVDNIETELGATNSDAPDMTDLGATNSDAPDMTDLRVHPNDPEKVICSWLISRNSTQLAGILSFHIEFKCVDANGNVVYEWSTDDYNEIEIKARKKNGEAAVIEHTDLLEQWRTRIFGAGDSVMANIAAEGEAQVAAVKEESETQQEAVELKGAQTLDTIPEDYTAVDAMANEAVRSKANAIVGEAAGEAIVLKDSSNDYIRGMKLLGKSTQVTTTGKNLLDASKLVVGGIEVNGNIIKIYPSSTGQAIVSPVTLGEILSANVGETVTLSGTTTGPNLIYVIDTETSWYFGSSIVLTEAMLASQIFLYGAAIGTSATITNLMVRYPGTDDTYEPYTGGKPSPNPDYPQEIVSIGDGGEIITNLFGKNLLDLSRLTFGNAAYMTLTNTGFTFTRGSHTGGAYASFKMSVLKGQTVTFSGKGSSYKPLFIIYKDAVYGKQLVSAAGQVTYTADEDIPNALFTVIIGSTQGDCTFYDLQIESGNTATDYEPYKPVQSVTLDHTLHGIPVTSGGNYTDSDGQQWICDEVDLERGVYVQRIKNTSFNGGENWYQYGLHENGTVIYSIYSTEERPVKEKKQLSNLLNFNWTIGEKTPQNSFAIGATGGVYAVLSADTFPGIDDWKALLTEYNMNVQYILATSIETPLTAEEITAFKALRTNYPNTTILNDAGAWMSVKYNADTKAYVENLKVLKLVDSSTGVVYELKIVDGVLTVNPA